MNCVADFQPEQFVEVNYYKYADQNGNDYPTIKLLGVTISYVVEEIRDIVGLLSYYLRSIELKGSK